MSGTADEPVTYIVRTGWLRRERVRGTSTLLMNGTLTIYSGQLTVAQGTVQGDAIRSYSATGWRSYRVAPKVNHGK